jgi:hypothetical protein
VFLRLRRMFPALGEAIDSGSAGWVRQPPSEAPPHAQGLHHM